uniref:DnaJ-like protein 60 n=1 Tax=Lygus hesperus TaxID=30085 RepID=A0A0A9W7R7_LYGHE
MLAWGHVKQLKECSPLLSSVIKRCVSQSYYDILKVSQTCSSKDVRDAFITLSKQNHPDKHGNDPSMHERFVQINEAYSVLINPSTRRQYDMTLGSKRKLNAPHDVYTTRTTYTHKPSSQTKKQSGSSSYSSNSGGSTSHDYFYTSWEKRTASEEHRDNYYGIKGIRKVSNLKILLIIIGFTCVGGTLQWLAIRRLFQLSSEKRLKLRTETWR